MTVLRVNCSRGLRDIAICLVVSIMALMLASCGGSDNNAELIDQHKRLAGELQSNGLYRAAVEEYQKVLTFQELDNKTRGNVNYLIARIYFHDLKDYTGAAAYYLRAREYDPEGSFMPEASRNLVASLEKLGNVLDAKRQLDRATDIENQPASSDDVAVAKIGNRSIWLSEIDEAISALPAETQKRFLDRKTKLEFIHQYVGVELLYDAAVREDYLSDPEIVKQKDALVKHLLVDRFVTDKVIPEIKVDTLDVANYYQANKDKRYKGQPYDSVRAQVFMDYQNDKAEAAYGEYIGRLAKAERVEFLDHNVK